jgi:hypothetical protein
MKSHTCTVQLLAQLVALGALAALVCAASATALEQCYDIGFVTLARSGLSYGDNDEFGRLMDWKYSPIVRPVPAEDNFTQLLSSGEVRIGTAWILEYACNYLRYFLTVLDLKVLV